MLNIVLKQQKLYYLLRMRRVSTTFRYLIDYFLGIDERRRVQKYQSRDFSKFFENGCPSVVVLVKPKVHQIEEYFEYPSVKEIYVLTRDRW